MYNIVRSYLSNFVHAIGPLISNADPELLSYKLLNVFDSYNVLELIIHLFRFGKTIYIL